VAIAAHADTCMALRDDGRVAVWNVVPSETAPTNVPSDLEDVAAISVGGSYPAFACLAVRSNGAVVAWGQGLMVNVPANLSNVLAVSAGAYHALALRTDGTVVAWPDGSSLTADNHNYGQADVPPNLNNVISIAAGKFHSLALKSDGTVVAWGGGAEHGPPGVANIVAISAGDSQCLALKADGTVLEWISTMDGWDYGQYTVPSDLSNVVAIASSMTHNLAVYSAEPIIRVHPRSPPPTIAGETVSFSVSATSPTPITYQWRFNGADIAGATDAIMSVTNAQATNTGTYDVVVCSSYGCVTSKAATLSLKVADVQMMAVVTVQGEVGSNTRVDWSSDLKTWNTLTNFTLPYIPFRFADWDSLGQTHRFYRVVFEP
jgi:hypothetical protein